MQKHKKITVYIAGALFTKAECDFNLQIKKYLEKKCKDYATFLLPQERCVNLSDAFDIYSQCLSDVNSSHVMLAILDGTDVDSGTSFEIGYAFGQCMPILGLRIDFRQNGDDGGLNCMLSQSLTYTFFSSALDKDAKGFELTLDAISEKIKEQHKLLFKDE